MQYVFSTSKTRHYRFPTHVNDLVMDRADSTTTEVFMVVLEPGEAPPLHKHYDAEQVFFVVDGEGLLTISEEDEQFDLHSSDVVRIPPGVFHSMKCTGEKSLRYLSVDCFG